YRGHNYPNRFKVWISGQVRRVTKAIRREMRRRAAIEPVIGHLKEDHRMGRNYLTGRDGDRFNAVLAAAGYNFSLLLRWFEELLPPLSLILWHALLAASLHLTRCRKTFFTADYSYCVTNFDICSEPRSMGNAIASWRERRPISVALLQSSSERGVQAATA